MQPYEECNKCIATPWCKYYSGEVALKSDATSWCNPNYRLTKAIQLSNIPPAYIKANIYNIKVDKYNEQEVDNILRPAINNIVNAVDEGRNFVIFNKETGTGKTYFGASLLNHFIYKTCLTSRFDFENPLGLFVEYPALIDSLRYYRDDEEVLSLIEKIKTAPFVLFDDVGAGKLSEFALEQTYMLLNYRFNNKKATIFTSNLSLEQLKENMTSRIFSRMMNDAVCIKLGGLDRRLYKGE